MDLVEVADLALSLARSQGAEQTEAFAVGSRTLSLYVEDSRVKNLEEKTDRGVAIRVAIGSRLGEASTTLGPIERLEECARSATRAARISPPDPYFTGLPVGGDGYFPTPDIWDEEVANLGPEELSSRGMEIVNACLDSGEFKIPRGMIRTAEIETEVMNSTGLSHSHRSTLVYLHFTSMTSSGTPGEGVETYHSTRLDMDTEVIGRSLATGAGDSAKAIPFRGRKAVPILIPPSQLAEMLSTSIGFAVNSENVNRNRSPWSAMLGQSVASTALTVVNDPSDPRGVLSATHDDEGVPARRSTIIEGGTLRNHLYDRYNASMGGTSSTGNEMRRNPLNSQSIYQNGISVAPQNMVVLGGGGSQEDLMSGFDEAIIVDRFAWPQVNPITGGVGLEVRCARLLRSGSTEEIVKHALLTGNMYDSLGQVAGIANDHSVRGGWIVPTMAFDGMEIVGNP
jgi:PmbA protein